MEGIEDRIAKDISAFSDNVKIISERKLGQQEEEILRMAKDYCSDAKSWLDKKDFDTAFGCISYAHGLLDALLKLNGE